MWRRRRIDGSWKIYWAPGRSFDLSTTSSASVDVPGLVAFLNDSQVPSSLADGLEMVLVTKLSDAHGDYDDVLRRVRISGEKKNKLLHFSTFVHELGHHVDSFHSVVVDDPSLAGEQRKTGHLLRLQHTGKMGARQNVAEYFAVGFEVFYCGNVGSRSLLAQRHPELLKRLEIVHEIGLRASLKR